jgi:protein-S-isoprenylcysteine O-methyltransferase Ste14
MGQIIINYLGIFMIPLFAGFLIRFLCRRTKRPYVVTLCLAVLMAAAWIAERTLPANALLAVQASCAAAASLVTEGVFALRRGMRPG